MPPASDHDWRSAAPDGVPGSTKASSRNSTSGHTAPIAITMQPTIAMPALAELFAFCQAVI
jgi:hypothetical protein